MLRHQFVDAFPWPSVDQARQQVGEIELGIDAPLQPKSAFLRFPLVHRSVLEGSKGSISAGPTAAARPPFWPPRKVRFSGLRRRLCRAGPEGYHAEVPVAVHRLRAGAVGLDREVLEPGHVARLGHRDQLRQPAAVALVQVSREIRDRRQYAPLGGLADRDGSLSTVALEPCGPLGHPAVARFRICD